MTDYFDALETRTPAEREAALMAALPRQIAHAQAHSAAMGEILAGVDAAAITSRAVIVSGRGFSTGGCGATAFGGGVSPSPGS